MAYVARLLIHRYAMLGVLNEEGFPLREMGVLESPTKRAASQPNSPAAAARNAATRP